MKFIAALTATLLSTSSFAAPPAAKQEFNICYFSLNKHDEFELAKGFMDKLNANSFVKINVLEFQPDKDAIPNPKDATPNVAFRKMVESGTKCDGLVISGHHTGSYGGKRTFNKSRLTMDFMEALSCDPRYDSFFKNINAVWLEGCRTLGVGAIGVGQEDTNRFNPDFHTNRVGAVVAEDELGQNFTQLNTEFTSTLDQDNPLSSRYLRLFPSAKLFGWTQTAPGEKANSQYSLLFHIAHMSKIMDEGDTFPKESPASPTLTPDSVARYVDAVLLALNRFTPAEQNCEELTTAAWINHGTLKPGNTRYAFDNPDLTALTPLFSSGNENLRTMRALECELKAAGRSNDLKKLNGVLDTIVARPDLIPYAFNSLVDLRNQALKGAVAEKDPAVRAKKQEIADTILERLKTQPAVTTFLENKISSKQLGILRKIDYYKFYQSLTGTSLPNVQNDIEANIVDQLKQPLPRTSQTSRNLARDYRNTLLQSGLKNKMLSARVADTILAANPEWDALEAVAKNVSYLPISNDEKINLLNRIGNFNQGNSILTGQILTSMHELVGRDPADRRYQEMYNRLMPKFGKINDYWQGETHAADGSTISGTDPASIPPPGSIGGPPGRAGAGGAIANTPVAPSPQAQPGISQPIEAFTGFFRGIFGG